ncbi:MAG: hypothetical protein IPH31_22200 [Lewinellaceae bacterium]|nr:hypothetical protein [Lewinellaceae bacterium]
MNLELKEEYKKGAFGKITAAVGTEERWAGRGNYNRFNQKEQLSFIGYGNNINQTGVNWEDYGEFKGQNTFGGQDNGDFGFSQGGRYYMIGGDDVPISWFDGRGFTKNFGGGTNYNFDNKKTKFNISYFYNQTELNVDQYTNRQTFLSDTSFLSPIRPASWISGAITAFHPPGAGAGLLQYIDHQGNRSHRQYKWFATGSINFSPMKTTTPSILSTSTTPTMATTGA